MAKPVIDTTLDLRNPLPCVFISYSRADIRFARSIVDGLKERKVDAWIDWEGIPPSAEWWNEVERAIEASEGFVFIISPDSVSSKICCEEVVHALRHNKRLIPLVCRDTAVNEAASSSDVAVALARIKWIFMRESDPFGEGISRLVRAIETDLEWMREHGRILQRAIEWDRHRRDTSYVLQDKDL